MQTPELEYLCGGYFNQDWGLDYEDEWAALSDYLDDPGVDPSALLIDIERLLVAEESDVETRLREFGCAFTGAEPYGGYRGWLDEIARRVRAGLNQPS